MDIREIVAVNVRSLRSAAGLSQEELAHRARIDRTYVSSIERMRYAASVDVVARIAKVFGVEPFTLLQRPD
jgi:transcriptional regulator with XRE-family HTH domain